MNTKEIVKAWLIENGFDGLINAEAGCGCALDDLYPCGESWAECEAAYKSKCSGIDSEGLQCDFLMFPTRRACDEHDRIAKENKEES